MTAFVTIPSGSFLMGSERGQDDERPVHRVFVDAFALAVFPVTRAEYSRFLEVGGHEAPRDWQAGEGRPDLPVTGVSWLDAAAYCRWQTGQGNAVRLPTEAEWERAARGGVEGADYPGGDFLPAWLPDGGRGPLAGPWPVTLAPPNEFGVRGIGGNIHEWCADWHSAGYYAASPERNPTGPSSGARRASRGGSWRHAWTMSRCAQRSKLDPSFRYTDYGFRIARSV